MQLFFQLHRLRFVEGVVLLFFFWKFWKLRRLQSELEVKQKILGGQFVELREDFKEKQELTEKEKRWLYTYLKVRPYSEEGLKEI